MVALKSDILVVLGRPPYVFPRYIPLQKILKNLSFFGSAVPTEKGTLQTPLDTCIHMIQTRQIYAYIDTSTDIHYRFYIVFLTNNNLISD